MKTIRFVPDGVAVSDFDVYKYVDNIMNSDEMEFDVSSHIVIDEIRARIRESRIGVDDVDVWVTDQAGNYKHFAIDKDGRSSDWLPFQDVRDDIIGRLI